MRTACINVFVPTDSMNHNKKFDVLVIIHGGAFMMGSGHSTAQSQFLVDRDLIFVTLNYRLGIFGFLSTQDEEIPGNYGMKDQTLALKWVNENIASFGGKPESITISGLSAGGASVHLHYFSPLSKGLFVRGLSQSGTALDPWVIRRHPLERARKLGSLLGCSDESTQEMKKCLKQKPARVILEKQNYFYGVGEGLARLPLSPFSPVVETKSKNPFLAEEPFSMLRDGKVLDVPWIVSRCANEGLFPAVFYHSDTDKLNNDWSKIARYMLDYNYTLSESKQEDVAKQIKEFYLGPQENINKENFKKLIQMLTDRLFGIGSEAAAKLQSEANKSPVYYYYFNYQKGKYKAIRLFVPTAVGIEGTTYITYIHTDQANLYATLGVSHGEDMLYFYGFPGLKDFSEEDKKLMNACQDMLYSYATTGIPSFDGTDKWLPTKHSELTYLNITDASDIKLETVDSLTPVDFWKSVGLLEYEVYGSKANTKTEL
ncbi:hypothetical protein NQ318_008411 [Aromia moschata]|uniref:Carboxylic ester hydrolase n=1 Tax=Aromia moschata TaxID=1265417 RepID=A0AAV8X592_9CUCU|nr:hypothetical protein NQ318_008411 [Aromia moschata]